MSTPSRFLRFNLVGIAGFVVQMTTLAVLAQWWSIPAGIAVAVAVLVAVSHNFLWHERVTWPGLPARRRWRRWVAFNASAGAVSVLANLVVTSIVMTATGAPLLIANLAAVVSASIVNFVVSDRLVFVASRASMTCPR